MKRALLLIFCLLFFLTGCGGSGSTEPEAEQEASNATPINQSISFGDFTVNADSFTIENGDLTLTLTITNNAANGYTVNDIIGTYAEQAGVILSQGNNAYNSDNDSALGEYVDPGTSRTIDLKYKLQTEDNIFDILIFNDSSLGLGDNGVQLELQINPADNTCQSSIS